MPPARPPAPNIIFFLKMLNAPTEVIIFKYRNILWTPLLSGKSKSLLEIHNITQKLFIFQ